MASLKNLITKTGLNLLTSVWKQLLNNSSTNVKSANVPQPTQYKTPAQPPVQTTTPVKTTPVIQNVKPVNTQYATPVNSTPAVNNQSRFIGFQNNFWVQNQFTQQAQNVINWNTAQQNITQAWINNKKKEVLTIPTIAETVKKNNNTKAQNYIKQMKVVQDFEADVYKNNWQMTQEQVARLYPEFAWNLPKAMELQKALYPIVRNWEYVDETQIRKYFPEILEDPKLTNYNSKQLELTSKLLNAWLTGSTKKFTRLLEEDGDVLTSRGQQYLQSLIELSNVAKNYRKNYNIKWNPTDADILLYAMQNDENVKNLVQQAQALELTELDKATISRSSDSNIINLLSDYQKSLRTASNEYQRNIQNPVNEWIESGLQALENQWIWTQTPRVFSSIVKTPVNMVWGILWGQNKLTTATDRLLLGQEENAGQVATDLFKAWAGWLETYFNVWMPLATAIYYTATNTKEWEVANEWTLWLFNEWIDNILSGKEWVWAINWLKLSQDNPIVQWYNSLDDETKADVQLDITTAVLHWYHKSTKADRDYIWIRVNTAKDAVVNAFQRWKWASYFQAWVEEWLKKNNNWQVQKWAVQRIVREWINEFWDALKENFSRFNEVVKAREEARRTAPQTEWGVVPQDNNILRDNRTFGEKAKSTVKNTYNDIASKTKDIFKKEDKAEVVETKNEVTAKEPEVDENWWMKPQETTMNKVTSWIWKTIDKAVETVKKPVNKVAEVVADTFTANSTPQDKLFKAVNPSHNILSNKKGNFQKKRSNSDRTNQLIIEYWHQPKNSAEYYANLIATKQQLWKENIAKGLDEHKFTEVDTKWIVASVLDELWVKPDHLLESNRGSYDKLQAELQSLLDKQKITLEHIESIKQQLNAKLNYWKPVEEGQIYEEWMRILNRKLSEIEDTMISEIPWEFNKFKRDYWALKDMEQDVLKMWLRDMKKKNWGWGLIKNVWRIEAIWNAIDKPLTATLQWIMWEATDMARDNDYLISKWFEQLAKQFKGEKKTLNIKQKPWEEWGEITTEEPKWPTPSTPKNEITSKAPKKETKKSEKKSEKKPVEQKKEELKNEITKKEEPKKEEVVKKAEKPKEEKKNAITSKNEEENLTEYTKEVVDEMDKLDKEATKYDDLKNMPETEDIEELDNEEKLWIKKQGKGNKFTNAIVDLIEERWEAIGDNKIALKDKNGRTHYTIEKNWNEIEIYNWEEKDIGEFTSDVNTFILNENGSLTPKTEDDAYWVKSIVDWYWLKQWILDGDNWNIRKQTVEEYEKQNKSDLTSSKNEVTQNDTATKINNIKSFDDLSNMFEFERPWEKADWYYVWTLNWVKTKVWEVWNTIFIKYWDENGTPAQARISKNEPDHIDQLKELLSEINNDGEILETNRNNYNPAKKNEVTASKNELTTKSVDLDKDIKDIDDFKKDIIAKRDTDGKIGLLNRMKSDVDYIVNNNLWEWWYRHLRATGKPERHIEYMKALYDSIPENERPDISIKDYAKKLGVDLKEKNVFWLSNQKPWSRINNFTNTINKILEKYADKVDEYNHSLLINLWKPYLPLSIEYYPVLKQLIVSHPNWEFDDPAIRFKINDDGSLTPTGIKQAFMQQMWLNNRAPIKPTDELLHTWAVNLEDQYLGKNTIDEDTGKVSEPKTAVTDTKNEITKKTENKTLKDFNDEASVKLSNENSFENLEKDYWLRKFSDTLWLVDAMTMADKWKITNDYYFWNLYWTPVIFKNTPWVNNPYSVSIGWEITHWTDWVPPMMMTPKEYHEWESEQWVIWKLNKYLNREKEKDLKSSENTNIISNKNDLTSNPNNNGNTNLWTSTQTIWWSNQWKGWELRNEVSSIKPNEWNEAWIQRTSSSNGSTEMNTSWKSTNLSWNGSTTWLESSGVKTVGQQRKINEESRNILEKHNFSTSRSDYTQDELNTLFQYEWNWGLAKAWDENIKGTRYEYYTPKNAVDALQRWLEKYTDKAIESVEDPTAGKWNMLAWFGDNVKKVMYEISPISWTIAKLRFPDAKVWIGEKDGDFQRRYLNYQGQKAYDFPRDGSNNVDALLINPPFGKRITIKDEPKIKALEDYFVKRSIEHDLRFNGVAGLLMPSRWLKAEDSITKQWLANNTEFVDAYRLPAWVFSYTDVGTDLIILKKKSGVDNASRFFDDNYFKENPDKVLWVEKERSTRHWMETYIDWDPNVINTLWTDNTAPVKMNSLTETPKTEITAKTQAPVENMPKNLITNPEQAKIEPKTEEKSENMEFKPDKKAQKTADAKKDTEKKPAKRGKNEKITTSKWTKTDIWTYEANWNEKTYKYQGMTNADWYIEDISVWEFKDAKVLNFIDNKAQIDDLYFAGNIYEKLSQLEKDKEAIIDKFGEEQYNKQKQWLEKVLPPKLTVEDITWSPTDKEILKLKTNQVSTYYDYSIREDVTENKTVQQVFEDWMWKKWNDEFVWTDTDKRKIMNYVKGKKWQPERLSQRYNESDAEFELRKKNKKAEEEQSKQATRERAKTFFNDFVKLELDKDIQDKITEEYNTRLRAVVKPDYKHMPLQVKDMSATFHWKPLVIDPVQIEWINAMLSKGSMLIAHGVWYWKTLEWVIATVWSMQRWWTKRPLMIVPKWTRQDWINTIHDLFPNQEVIDLWGLDAGDIKRLRKDLWDDPSKWVKDWQIAIITHPWFDGKINFKSATQEELQKDLRDVMWSEENTARQDDTLSENIENIAETINKKKDNKKLRGIKWELSAKYGDEVLEQLDSDLENMSKAEFVENFVSKVSELERFKETPEEVLKADAEAMYETKPVYLEDLGIDHITIDEVHNYKNIFTSAKLKKDKKWNSWETNPYGSISGSSSSRGRKMFATSQYILKKNNWRWVFSLSATPFNNQPIEVYNMLSLHAYNRLVEKWIQNINSFFDHFADFRTEFIANALKKWWWEYWQVMKDFNNLPEMQRLIGEYIDYVWDNPNLVRPEKRMKKVVLTPSDKQREVQEYLQKREAQIAASKWSWNKESVLPLYTDMRLNIISPYLTSYGKLNYDVPTAKEFIESSPKLKFAVDTIKALRDEGRNDWVFIYMPYWIEYHSLLQQAIEEAVGKDKVKVWIINGSTTWTETVDGEKVEKRIAIADKFRKWELNVLIWGRNTVEWINLQDNWFITINTLIWWNPTEITQLNGRIHRQGNLRDHVIELLPLLTDWWDVMMMQKYDEKANRINNIFESQWRTFNLEELDPEEEKMALNTDPKRKAELSVEIDKKKLDKDIQKYTAQNWTLNDIINRMPEEADIQYYKDEVEKLQKESKEIKEAMKALNPESSAYSSLSWDFDSKQRQLKNAKERLKDKERDLQWATAKMNSYAIDNIEWVKARIDENKQKISDLVDTKDKLDAEMPQRIAKFQKEYEEWKKNMKTPEEYIEDLKEDFRSLKVFGERKELKDYLEARKKEAPKTQPKVKNEVTATQKNEITSRKSSVVSEAMSKIEPLVKKMRSINSVLENMWMMMTEKEKEAMRNSWKKARQDIVDILMESGKENRNAIIWRIHDVDEWAWLDFDKYVVLDDEEPKNEITSKRSLKESMPRNVLTANVDDLLKKNAITSKNSWNLKKSEHNNGGVIADSNVHRVSSDSVSNDTTITPFSSNTKKVKKKPLTEEAKKRVRQYKSAKRNIRKLEKKWKYDEMYWAIKWFNWLWHWLSDFTGDPKWKKQAYTEKDNFAIKEIKRRWPSIIRRDNRTVDNKWNKKKPWYSLTDPRWKPAFHVKYKVGRFAKKEKKRLRKQNKI